MDMGESRPIGLTSAMVLERNHQRDCIEDQQDRRIGVEVVERFSFLGGGGLDARCDMCFSVSRGVWAARVPQEWTLSRAMVTARRNVLVWVIFVLRIHRRRITVRR